MEYSIGVRKLLLKGLVRNGMIPRRKAWQRVNMDSASELPVKDLWETLPLLNMPDVEVSTCWSKCVAITPMTIQMVLKSSREELGQEQGRPKFTRVSIHELGKLAIEENGFTMKVVSGGAPVVVRAWESHAHGEGVQSAIDGGVKEK